MAPVTITYTSHPAPSQPINQAIKSLKDQLPLRNLHWKPTTRTSLRTIQELNVELVELGDVPTGGRSALGSVLEQPLVNLCMVVCEDSETYKNSTKSFIRDWLSLLSSRRGTVAPLIILVNPPTAVVTSGKNVFGRDIGVLGKLKSDFNTGKRDRCVQVNLPAEGRDDPAAWPEVVNKIKESVVLAFDAAIVEREEEVKRGEAQRMMVGWNFCTWFLLKESLAHSFEAVGLPSDALVIYEELEATFFQILKEQNLSWFGKLGATSPNDDSLPVLDVRSKPYREMLQGSAISIFDFRVYVFARQAKLLGQLGRITEVAKRGQWFVASLTRRLRESEEDLAEHFIESWTYTACMDVVQRCDEWSRIDRPNGDYSGLVAYESARSELLDIARVQVERIGVAVGHLPNAYPFAASSALLTVADDVLFESSETGSLPDEGEKETYPRLQMSNKQLVQAKNDAKVFRELYTTLTKKAILAYEACGKVNSIIRLKTDLAALALHIQDWRLAYELCCTSAKECATQSVWTPVAKFSLEGAIRSHRELGSARGTEWTMLALAYLRVCALLPSGLDAGELEWVMSSLSDCEGLDENVEQHDAFEVQFLDEVAQHGDRPDYSVVTVEVKNKLPVPISLSNISSGWQSSSSDGLFFDAKKSTLQPGINTIKLTCRMLAQGIYELRGTEFEVGKLAFSYAPPYSGTQLLMRRPPGAVHAKLTLPRHNALDGDTEVVVRIQTNSCSLKNARLQLESMEDAMQYDLSVAQADGQAMSHQDNALILGDLEAGTTRDVVIPYLGTPHGDNASAYVTIMYTAEDGVESTWTETQDIRVALPMTVNVQDFFRPDCLVSQFTMAADSDESLRIASVELQPPASGYTVDAGSRKADPVTLAPAQSLTRVLRIRPTGAQGGNGPAVLRLVIHYLTVDEELEASIETVLDVTTSSGLRRAVHRRLKDRTLINGYASRGWSAMFDSSWAEEVVAKGQSTTKEIEDLLERLTTMPKPDVMRTLEIPVDVPSRRILTTVTMEPRTPDKGRIYEGRAIPVRIQMRTSFAWAGDAEERTGKMVYDIVPLIEDWLVIGVKRGYFLLEGTEGVVEREIVLVPMRSGRLFLPIVTVNLADSKGEDGLISETYLENAVEAIEVLPAKSGGVAMIPLEPTWEVDAERRL